MTAALLFLGLFGVMVVLIGVIWWLLSSALGWLNELDQDE